jgi:hypothetical protein
VTRGNLYGTYLKNSGIVYPVKLLSKFHEVKLFNWGGNVPHYSLHGEMQNEAYFFGMPCVTLRPEAEWTETLEDGWNKMVGTDSSLMVQKALNMQPSLATRKIFDDGRAGTRILHKLENTIM